MPITWAASTRPWAGDDRMVVGNQNRIGKAEAFDASVRQGCLPRQIWERLPSRRRRHFQIGLRLSKTGKRFSPLAMNASLMSSGRNMAAFHTDT